MQTKVSSKGQVVLPIAIRNKLRIKEGDSLEARLEGNAILLIPKSPIRRKGRIVKDKVTGLPVLTVGPGGPKLTSEMVEKFMEDFP